MSASKQEPTGLPEQDEKPSETEVASADEAARIARAARLREQITRFVSPDSEDSQDNRAAETGVSEPNAADGDESAPVENPRDFIHRRMQEDEKRES